MLQAKSQECTDLSRLSLVPAGQRDISSPIQRHYLLTQYPKPDTDIPLSLSSKFDEHPPENALVRHFCRHFALASPAPHMMPPLAASEIESVRLPPSQMGSAALLLSLARCLGRDAYLANRSRPNKSMDGINNLIYGAFP